MRNSVDEFPLIPLVIWVIILGLLLEFSFADHNLIVLPFLQTPLELGPIWIFNLHNIAVATLPEQVPIAHIQFVQIHHRVTHLLIEKIARKCSTTPSTSIWSSRLRTHQPLMLMLLIFQLQLLLVHLVNRWQELYSFCPLLLVLMAG